LLTDCAFGLRPSFLSRSRWWPIYLWHVVPRASTSGIVTFPSRRKTMIHCTTSGLFKPPCKTMKSPKLDFV
jgi:hypothetical protein